MRHWARRHRRGPLETLTLGFVLFLMLCAVLLLVFPSHDQGRAQTPPGTTPTEVHQALGEIEAAAQAFDSANYGQARWHISQARKTLGGLLPAAE